jgi:dihydrofolate reductase
MNNFNKIKFRAILAWDEQGGIGINNKIPWKHPEDLKKFRQRTTDGTVIMGRNTQDSIQKPLPNRNNITVSSKNMNVKEGFKWAISAQDSISECNKLGVKEAWVIGGPSLIKEFINADLISSFYITCVPGTYETDTKFDVELVRGWLPVLLDTDDKGLTYWALYPPNKESETPTIHKWEWFDNYDKLKIPKQTVKMIEWFDFDLQKSREAAIVGELLNSYIVDIPHAHIENANTIISKNDMIRIFEKNV